MWVSGLRVGPLRLTAFGAWAAVGVVAGMAVSGRAGRRLGLAAETIWDVGMVAVVSCFAASRLLLVVEDVRAFWRYPLAVLELPSLTFGGMALAGMVVWGYVRRRGLPVRRVMDAFAPGGAVLAACLEAGHWVEGTELGMPVLRGDEVVGVRPVAVWGVGVSLGLAVGLWILLRRGLRGGRVAAAGLMVGGLAAFGLDLVSLPAVMFAGWALEPGEVVALGAMVVGAGMWSEALR